jgi:hypothetical protein
LSSIKTGRDKISVGLWIYDRFDRVKVLARGGALSLALSHHCYARAFGEKPAKMRASAA